MSDQNVVIPHQYEIQVFVNGEGTISIASDIGDDCILAFHHTHAKALIRAIQRAAAQAKAAEKE